MFVSENDVREFKKWCGYHLMNSSHYQKALFIVGPAGYSKGTLFRTITKVIGEENCSSAPLKALCNDNLYSIKFIEHKIANICGDLATSKLTGAELSAYYNIVGEDLMHGRQILHMPTDFRPRAKLAWAFNKFPMLAMSVFNANEFWRRCIILETRVYKFVKDNEFEEKLVLEIPGIYNKFFEEGARLLVEEGFKEYNKNNFIALKNKWLTHMRSASDDKVLEPEQLMEKLEEEQESEEELQNAKEVSVTDEVMKIPEKKVVSKKE